MTSARTRSRHARAASASTPWAPITALASPHWCWTARGAAASPTRARASVTAPPQARSVLPRLRLTRCQATPSQGPRPLSIALSRLLQPHLSCFGVRLSGQPAWWLKAKAFRGDCNLLAVCTRAHFLLPLGPKLPFCTLGGLTIALPYRVVGTNFLF